jgi:hypothetical protein
MSPIQIGEATDNTDDTIANLENEVRKLEADAFYWRDKYKGMQQRWMCLKDDYAQLARAAGSPGRSWWGDPLEGHGEILKRIEALVHLRDAPEQKVVSEADGPHSPPAPDKQ